MSIKANQLNKLSNDELIKIMIDMKVMYDKELDEKREKYLKLQKIYDSCVDTLTGASDTANTCSKCDLWFEEGYGGFECQECNNLFCYDCGGEQDEDEDEDEKENICKCCKK